MKYDDFVHAGGRETQVKVSRSFMLKLSGNTRPCKNDGFSCIVFLFNSNLGVSLCMKETQITFF